MTFYFKKSLISSLVIGIFCFSLSMACAYAQQTRILAGEVTLDVGVAPEDLLIDITVNNHSLLVVPPFFAIVRPITSMQTRRITIGKGKASASYSIDSIISDNPRPIDYTVAIECVNCSDVFRGQYYAESGNRFGRVNEVFLDPDTLAEVLSLSIVSDVRLNGEIKLADGALADRNLIYIISIGSPANQNIVYLRSSNITLLEGQNSVSYQLTGLSREIGSGEFVISALCTNCFADSAAPQLFPQILSTSQNHSNIDFLVIDQAPVVISPILKILLY